MWINTSSPSPKIPHYKVRTRALQDSVLTSLLSDEEEHHERPINKNSTEEHIYIRAHHMDCMKKKERKKKEKRKKKATKLLSPCKMTSKCCLHHDLLRRLTAGVFAGAGFNLTKLSGNIPRAPSTSPSHQPTSAYIDTCIHSGCKVRWAVAQ